MPNKSNTIQVILNMDGSVLDTRNGFITSINEYSNSIQVISPFPISDSVSVNYYLQDTTMTNYTQYLVPLKDNQNNTILAKNIVDPTKPYYQTIKDWNVWQVPISNKALRAISKYHSGSINIAITFREYKTILPLEAKNNKGTFGLYTSNLKTDLPLTAVEGDFYKCSHYFYYSSNADLTFTYGDLAIWFESGWIISKPYEYRIGSPSITIGVEASILGQSITGIDLDLTEQMLERLAFLESAFTGSLSDIEYLEFNKN